jgi:acyl carrier protein phosphodiesterase
MNYLGHALLSFGDPQLLTGNMIGDYVKGRKILEAYPDRIRQGILLHRSIDSFADAHPSSLRAKNLFRPYYRLYAGAFIDTLYDHFLANDPRYFPSEKDLFDYAATVYAQLQEQEAFLPDQFKVMLPHMVSSNWLYNYRTLKGMAQSFNGLVRRATYLDSSEKAYEIFVAHYYELNQYYFDFMDDMMEFVKNQLNDLQPDR